MAFENMKMKSSLETLDSLDANDIEQFISIFNTYKDIEAASYYLITTSRLSIINSLKEKVGTNELERLLQEQIFDNLWLLDPSWERATELVEMEKTIEMIDDKDDSKIKNKIFLINLQNALIDGFLVNVFDTKKKLLFDLAFDSVPNSQKLIKEITEILYPQKEIKKAKTEENHSRDLFNPDLFGWECDRNNLGVKNA